MKQRVHVYVLYEKGMKSKGLREICAGLEEEGVPFSCIEQEKSDVFELGRQAALLSPLEIGIGVSANGDCAICHEKLANPYVREQVSNGRMAGRHAARLVKGLPLF